MHSTRRFIFASMLTAIFASGVLAASFEVDDQEPEVTDRVARISFIKGDVTIRRAGNDEWEKAALNLPIVEGDEIATSSDSRFEIQFNTRTYVRVNENSFFKVTTLNDSGIALSLPEGSLSLTATKFDPDKAFLEIDAPKTTVAVQRSGRYRIDAGKAGATEIRVSVADDGEARVYSNNSGFSLRDGRNARIFIDGQNAGEWENGSAALLTDEFDEWSADRDAFEAKRLSSSYYGQYYDDDIYGAEDLNDNGDWVHTRDYGYIWRPNQSSLASYSDWSPYRYGHWRWLPSYGWTWVNDEPWGWATYHHGRWIRYNSAWYWSPYGYYRQRRSWWYPALVVLRVIDRNVCWYPLPYHYGYYNYNHNYYAGRPRHGGRPGNGPAAPTPRPSPGYQIVGQLPEDPPIVKSTGTRSDLPDTGVISMPIDDFGMRKGVLSKLSAQTARKIITEPVVQGELPRLPVMRDIKTKVNRDIRADSPKFVPVNTDSTTGAAKRDQGEPLDKGLRDKIIYGNRPVIRTTEPVDTRNSAPDRKTAPATGAVGRPIVRSIEPIRTDPVRTEPVRAIPPRTEPPVQKKERSIEPTKQDSPRDDTPVRAIPPRSEPVKRSDPPPQKSEPRPEPPTRRSDPPPQKSEPRSEPTKKSDPPPSKSERTAEPSKSTDKKPGR